MMDALATVENFRNIDSTNCRESRLVCEFFERRHHGFYLDVGANHPTEQSQTWFLETKGWTGILVEPNPRLCELLRQHRPGSRVIQAAACGPNDFGEAELHLGECDAHSTLKPEFDHALNGARICVPMRPLDSILAEANSSGVDFISVDVEGMELAALQGLNLEYWQPQLLLVEDHFYHRQVHSYLRRMRYKLVRRTGYNNWYVPEGSPLTLLQASSAGELVNLFRKMWLAPPWNRIRRAIKKRRFEK